MIFMHLQAKKFTNVYIKNFPESVTEEKLRDMFEAYGSITSYRIMQDESGKSRGFGFVAFEDPEIAERACVELNGKEMEGKTLYVGRAQKRAGVYTFRALVQFVASSWN